jgi:hypothetical protein
MKAVARAASKAGGLTGSLIFACCDAINLAVQQPARIFVHKIFAEMASAPGFAIRDAASSSG